MTVTAQRSFEKDISKISDAILAYKVDAVIEELEECKSISSIQHIKKMSAQGKYYRVRIGDYRLGFKEENYTIILLWFTHRKDIYKWIFINIFLN